jgi:predicted MFS family arabinose efflux permease
VGPPILCRKKPEITKNSNYSDRQSVVAGRKTISVDSQLEAQASEPFASAAFIRDRATWLSYLILGYFAFLETSLGPLMPSLRANLGFSYTIASLHFSALALGLMIAGLFGERIGQRWGRRAMFWRGTAVASAGALLLIFSPIAAGTIFAALVMGGAGALMAIAGQASLAERHGSQRAVALAEANVTASICAMLASIAVGGFERTTFGWRGALVIAVVWCGVMALKFHDGPHQQQLPPGPEHRAGSAHLPRAFRAFAAVLFLGVAVEWCLAFWGSDFLTQSAGMSPSTAAAAMSAFFIAMVLGRMTGSVLARRVSSSRLLLIALGLATITLPIFWLAGTAVVALTSLFFVGFGLANVYLFTFTAALETVSSSPDLATARLILTGSSSVLLAPFALGVLADRIGITDAFGIAILFAALAFLLVLSLHVRR